MEELKFLNEKEDYLPDNKRIILQAMRNIIFNHTNEFRNSCSEHKCENCESKDDIQVNHLPPNVFSKIADDFIESNDIIFHNIQVFSEDEHYKIDKFIFYQDEDITEKWKDFHNSRAKYNLLCKNCNMKSRSYGYKYKHCVGRIKKKKLSKESRGELVKTLLASSSHPPLQVISVSKKRTLKEITLI